MEKEASDEWESLKMANNFNEGKETSEESNVSRNIHMKCGFVLFFPKGSNETKKKL